MSSRTITTCDRCGHEMTRHTEVHRFMEESYSRTFGSTYSRTDHYDLCPICAAEFHEFMRKYKA